MTRRVYVSSSFVPKTMSRITPTAEATSAATSAHQKLSTWIALGAIAETASSIAASRSRITPNPASAMNGIRTAATIGGMIAFRTAITSVASAAPPKFPTSTAGTSFAAISRAAAASSQERSSRPGRKRGLTGCQSVVFSPYTIEVIGIEGRPNHITYLGHATTVIEIDGARVLTDPVLRWRAAHLLRTGPAPKPGDVDAVLVSHGHYDHLDLASLERLPRDVPVILARGLGRLVEARGLRQRGRGRGGRRGSGRRRRRPGDARGSSWPGGTGAHCTVTVGFAVLGSHRVFFAGDTDLFPEMDGLVDDLDVALLPIWGWGPTMGTGHLDPERAAEALTLLRPKVAVPIHWGTLRPFYKSAKAPPRSHPRPSPPPRGSRRVTVRVLRGEQLELEGRAVLAARGWPVRAARRVGLGGILIPTGQLG